MNRKIISRKYIQRIANEIKLERFAEAAEDSKVFSVLLNLWAMCDKRKQESATRGMHRIKGNRM